MTTDPAPPKGEVRVDEPTRAQQSVARRVAESRATVPDFTADAEAVLRPGDASVSEALLVHAAARALREVPQVNGAYRDGRFERYGRVNVALAVHADGAVVLPTVYDADAKGTVALHDELQDLADRARAGTLAPAELRGATFTVHRADVARLTPVIVPAQGAALGAGSVRAAPVVRDGAPAAGHVLTVTLACDHRMLTPADAAAWLARFRAALEG